MDKRRIESGHFKFFRQLVGDFPDGEVWHDDKPDFLVYASSGVIGVEHRQVFKPTKGHETSLKAIESQIEEIVSLAQEHAELRGMPPVHVGLFFDLDGKLRKKQRLNLARDITRFICLNLPPDDERVTLEYGSGHRGSIPETLDLAIVTRGRKRTRHHWISSEAGSILSDCRKMIQEAIDEKTPKISSYLGNCSACWLLLCSDGCQPSNFIHPDEVSRDYTYVSPFNRTYFLDCAQGDLTLLRTVEK